LRFALLRAELGRAAHRPHARNGAEPNHSYPRANVPVLTRSLQAAGYEVAAFSKVAHDYMNLTAGFDYYSPDRLHLADSMRAYFHRRKSTKPICVLLGDKRPHVFWSPQSTYDPAAVTLPADWIDMPETRAYRARYYTDITCMDTEPGRVLDLSSKLFGDKAILLFSSDHGAQWPFGKWNLYDAGIRTPLVVAWPDKVGAGQDTAAMVSWVDILPTLLDITTTPTPAGLDGKSFAPVLLGRATRHRDVIYTTHSGDGPENVYPIRSVRTARYKYIRNLHPEYLHTNHSDLYRKDGAGAYWNSWLEKAKTAIL
jgi:arylsulfatase A-like enzyme